MPFRRPRAAESSVCLLFSVNASAVREGAALGGRERAGQRQFLSAEASPLNQKNLCWIDSLPASTSLDRKRHAARGAPLRLLQPPMTKRDPSQSESPGPLLQNLPSNTVPHMFPWSNVARASALMQIGRAYARD